MKTIPNRLQMLLSKIGRGVKETCILDCYNQRVWEDVSPSVTSRMPDSSNYFIYEQQETGTITP